MEKGKIYELIEKYDLTDVIKYDEKFESIIKSKSDEEDLKDFIRFYFGSNDRMMNMLIKLNYPKLLEKIKNYKTNYYVKFVYENNVAYNGNDKKDKLIKFIENEILSSDEGFNTKLIENFVTEKYDSFVGKRRREIEKIKERVYKFKSELNDKTLNSQYFDLIDSIENAYIGKYEAKNDFDLTLIEDLIDECKLQYKQNNITIFSDVNVDSDINEALDRTRNFIYTLKSIVLGIYDKSRLYDSEFMRQDSEQIYSFLSKHIAYLKKNESLSKDRIYTYLVKIGEELKEKSNKKEKTTLSRLDTFPYEQSAKEILIKGGMEETIANDKIISSSRKQIEELVRIKNDLNDLALIISKKMGLTKDDKTGFLFHIFGTMIDDKLLLSIGSMKAFTKENLPLFIVDVIFEKNSDVDFEQFKYYLCLIKPIINSMGLLKLYNEEDIEKEYKQRIKVKIK